MTFFVPPVTPIILGTLLDEEVDGKTHVVQEAIFSPRGLGGQLYWAVVSPFHSFIFPTMLKNIIKKAKADA
jgi:hypothetical protein